MVVICWNKSYKEPEPNTTYVRSVIFGAAFPDWLGLTHINSWKVGFIVFWET